MIISHKYKFIFIKTYKTAGTSLEVFLGNHCGQKDVVTPIYPFVEGHKPRNYRRLWQPGEDQYSGQYKTKVKLKDLVFPVRFYNHMPARLIKDSVGKRVWSGYFKFCIERNPWDKTLSHYHMMNHRRQGELSLDNYFQQQKFCLNYPLYLDHDGSMLVDEIVDYSNLNVELSRIFGSLGIDFSGTLTHRAKANYRKARKTYHEVFSDMQKEIVSKVFEKEISIHGYTY